MEYWPFLGCYCDLSQSTGLQKLEEHLARTAANVDQASPPEHCLSPTKMKGDMSETVESVTMSLEASSSDPSAGIPSDPSAGIPSELCGDLGLEDGDVMDEEVILTDKNRGSSSQCLDWVEENEEELVSAFTGLTLSDNEGRQSSATDYHGSVHPHPPPHLSGCLTPLRGAVTAGRKKATTRDIYLTG